MSVGAWLHESSEASRPVRVVVELGQVQRLLSLSEARALHKALGAALDEAHATVQAEDLVDDDDEEEP